MTFWKLAKLLTLPLFFENNLIAIDDADILFQVELQNVDYHYTKLSLLSS